MSSISTSQLFAVILASSAISVGSTVSLVRYMPELVAMPLPEPDIQLQSHLVTALQICEARTDWHGAEDWSTDFSLTQDSTVLVILSTRVSYDAQVNDPTAKAFVYVNTYIDEKRAEPGDVCLTYSSESAGMGQTVLFHMDGLKKGSHELTFQWRNYGNADGLLRNTVIEIVSIPDRNLL